MDDRVSSTTEELGYFLSYSAEGELLPAYTLTIIIRDVPTEAHYDPEAIQLCLLTPEQVVQRTKLTRQRHPAHERRVCPGPIHVIDRLGKQLAFFSYGGILHCAEDVVKSVFFLTSSAPILEMGEELNSFPALLAAESEAHLAIIHAQWASNDAGFSQRLIDTEPLALFRALLATIFHAGQASPALFSESPDFRKTLQQWVERWVVGDEEVAGLEVLLTPDPENHLN
ncbi:MAG: hypothetical protein DWI57_16035 [Chloroflexi bacterium]|nr:MAG: hypothetical protein DWI57_16035 [Chloroflexota bacterium]